MDEEKTLTIKRANNGYIICLDWCTRKGDEHEFHSEKYVMKSLPQEVAKMFEGKVDGDKSVEPKERERLSFDKALKEAEDMMDEEDEEEEED